MSELDFRRYLHHRDNPRVAGLKGHDAHSHARARMSQDLPRQLFLPWDALYAEPFRGVTSDGVVIPDLYALAPNGAPTEAMMAAAALLWASLSQTQRDAVSFPIDAPEWRRWNNTEIYMHPYGLRLEEMSQRQRQGVLAVIEASLSARGYDRVRDVMRLNHFLGLLVGAPEVLGEWSYNFSLFGSPSRSEPWGWQLFGHHLALNCLVIGDQLVISPTFMGAEPDYADEGPFPRHRLFEDEENGGLDLMRSLSPELRDRVQIYRSLTPGDGADIPPERWHRADQRHFGGAFQDNRIIPEEGVPASELSAEQRRNLLSLIGAYLDPLPKGPLKARMEEVERHLDRTRFSWIGGYGEESAFYYRIQSPVVMIEFDHHSGVFLANEEPKKFHVHTIVRTPNGNDYGMDLLRLHYEQAHDGQRPGHGAHHK